MEDLKAQLPQNKTFDGIPSRQIETEPSKTEQIKKQKKTNEYADNWDDDDTVAYKKEKKSQFNPQKQLTASF